MSDLDVIAQRALKICQDRGWERDWSGAGCYLHLEVSEFIESMRNKRGTMVEEAGDVLFVLLSTLAAHGVQISEVLDTMDNKMQMMNLDKLASRQARGVIKGTGDHR